MTVLADRLTAKPPDTTRHTAADRRRSSDYHSPGRDTRTHGGQPACNDNEETGYRANPHDRQRRHSQTRLRRDRQSISVRPERESYAEQRARLEEEASVGRPRPAGADLIFSRYR